MPNIKLFEDKKIRSKWDAEKETWYFSIVDVIAVLTESNNPQVYWRVLKKRLADQGNETVTNCNALKTEATDGKMRLNDVADTEQLLRLIQSIPSPKAEKAISFCNINQIIYDSQNIFVTIHKGTTRWSNT